MKRGDWLCPNCNFLNFARNRRCLECKADGPKKLEAATAEMKMGDWICIQCHFMNFARNTICFKCEEPRPKRQLNPGEWECPSCDFVNFSRNTICKKCNHGRPEDDAHDNQLGQRNMKRAGKNRNFDYIDQEEDNLRSVREERSPRRTIGKSRSAGFDKGDGLLTAKRSAEEDEDDDVLPYEGVRKHVVSRRAGPAQRKFTAARNQ
uniref:RanBP2-type domain-containing protein n=1 Tax=Arundo donax TaxID=35708 RepID=A0A0A9CU46_ARUDO